MHCLQKYRQFSRTQGLYLGSVQICCPYCLQSFLVSMHGAGVVGGPVEKIVQSCINYWIKLEFIISFILKLLLNVKIRAFITQKLVVREQSFRLISDSTCSYPDRSRSTGGSSHVPSPHMEPHKMSFRRPGSYPACPYKLRKINKNVSKYTCFGNIILLPKYET